MRITPGLFIEVERTGETKTGEFSTSLVICRMPPPQMAAEEGSFQSQQKRLNGKLASNQSKMRVCLWTMQSQVVKRFWVMKDACEPWTS